MTSDNVSIGDISRRNKLNASVDTEQLLTSVHTSDKYNTTNNTIHTSPIKRINKLFSAYLPAHILLYIHYWYVKYPLILALLIILAALIGYLVFQLIDAGYFDANVRDRLMVVYSMDDTYFTKIQGAFSDYEAGVGAICYGIDNGAAAVKLVYNNRLYVEPERGDNYWNYFWKSDTIILNPNIPQPYEEVHFNHWLARYGQLGSFTREGIYIYT